MAYIFKEIKSIPLTYFPYLPSVLHYLRFSHQYDVFLLQQDFIKATENSWIAHFNAKDYNGTWESISLRSHSGKSADITAHFGQTEYLDTPLMAQLPYIRSIVNSLNFEKEAIRLMALHPGAEILPHRDRGCSYIDGSFRLHIPIQTNSRVKFTVNGTNLFLDEGSLWYIDFDQTHAIRNDGDTLRCHLIIDGLRNEWSDEFFAAEGFEITGKETTYDHNTLKMMITELEVMKTPGVISLINDLRKQLNE